MRQFFSGFRLSLHLIRRRFALLLAAALLFALVGQAAAASLADAFSENGRGLTGLRIALSGSGAAEAAALAGQMQDVRAYCTFDAMDEAAAQAQLTAGKVSAVLLIPDGFLSSIYSGKNTTPTLLLDARRPLEGYLARWAGSCAISMLMDAQAGVTAVLDARAERKQAGAPLEKSKKKITQEINLRYIQQALGRSDLMRTETLSPTGALEPGDHYALSALSYLILLAGAVFFPLFDERARRGFLRRLQSAGGSLLPLRLSALTLCAGLSALLLGVPLATLAAGYFPFSGVLAGAVFASGLAGACAAACGRADGTALTLFLLSTGFLIAGGGLLPPALLPAPLRILLPYSPVRMLTLALSPARGYDAPAYSIPALTLTGAALWGISLLFAARRHQKETL